MAEGFQFFIGKFVVAYCAGGQEIKGTLVNIDKFGNADIISETVEGRMKLTISRPHLIAMGAILDKKI